MTWATIVVCRKCELDYLVWCIQIYSQDMPNTTIRKQTQVA